MLKMPVDYWRSAMVFGALMAEAQVVIAMRMMGSVGAWNLGPAENIRMVTEKASAATDAGQAMSRAIWRGASPAETALAVMQPIRKRTKNNVKRLTARGPVKKTRRPS